MTSGGSPGDRRRGDRRRRPTRPWDAFFLRPARRRGDRRSAAGGSGFVDRHPRGIGGLAILLVVLGLADGLMTLVLIDSPADEANPAMAALLRRGAIPFLAVKLLITAAGAAFFLTFRTFTVLGGRVRIARFLPAFVGLYILLLAYQAGLAWTLAGELPPHPIRDSGRIARDGAAFAD